MSNRAWNALVIALLVLLLACTIFVVFASFAYGVGAHSRAELTARWASPTIAAIRWQQPAGVALTCLTRETASGQRWPIRCWANLPAGATYTTLGDVGPRDYTAHPEIGDHYLLTLDDREERADLLSLVWLPIMQG